MEYFDYIILGAGINGCGIARELSLKLRKVLVIEKSSIGSGTSSKSSRLIHGGLRYLENYEFSLVKEALENRKELISLYPNIVQLEPFFIPIYKDSLRSPGVIWLGLKLYDFLGGSINDYHSSRVSFDYFFKVFANIKSERLLSVYRYYDAKTNDIMLTRRVAEDAKNMTAQFLENAVIHKIVNKNKIIIETNIGSFITHTLINATGPWIDEVNKKYNLPSRYKIVKVSGIHIEVDRRLVPFPVLMQTENNRAFFFIPEDNTTIIGTTERLETNLIDDIKIKTEDEDYLLKNLNKYITEPVKKNQVVKRWIGVRPLIEKKNDLSKISRNYQLELYKKENNKVLHVFGGKLTTFLSLARKVVKILEN